ncbi:MAG: NYN domain-containing protein [Planctomycetia bacterium]|nr:NYN domain-containing protein [Planctomycetia bacterium]
MLCVIDGYNLIYALGLLPAGARRMTYVPGKLAAAREALEGLLLRGLSSGVLRETLVVYDALEPPQFLPSAYVVKGMQVVFAKNYSSADELILETLKKHSKKDNITVVSSDHRIQAHAKRLKMAYYDSDEWYYGGMPIVGVSKGKKKRAEAKTSLSSSPRQKNTDKISQEEMDYWLTIFGDSGETSRNDSSNAQAPSRRGVPPRNEGKVPRL